MIWQPLITTLFELLVLFVGIYMGIRLAEYTSCPRPKPDEKWLIRHEGGIHVVEVISKLDDVFIVDFKTLPTNEKGVEDGEWQEIKLDQFIGRMDDI